jgi:uncharacterized protein (TIGR01777 family)
VLIAGGTGLVGTRLTQFLLEKNYEVRYLSHRKILQNDVKTFLWNIDSSYVDVNAFDDVTHLVNIAGVNIAEKPWTSSRKKELANSRIVGTQLLHKTIADNHISIESYVGASAIGIYEENLTELITEESNCANDFLGTLCQQWEQQHKQFEENKIRTTIFRLGLVQSTSGGMLKEALFPLKFFVAPVFGSGKQYVSWIHIDDLCRMILFAMENKSVRGIFNAIAPNPVTAFDYAHALQLTNNKLSFKINIPAFTLKIFFGKRMDMLLKNYNVSSNKIQQAGFEFLFSEYGNVIQDLEPV